MTFVGTCQNDGMYYYNESAFVYCTAGRSTVQHCPKGTKNPSFESYTTARNQQQSVLCSLDALSSSPGTDNFISSQQRHNSYQPEYKEQPQHQQQQPQQMSQQQQNNQQGSQQKHPQQQQPQQQPKQQPQQQQYQPQQQPKQQPQQQQYQPQQQPKQQPQQQQYQQQQQPKQQPQQQQYQPQQQQQQQQYQPQEQHSLYSQQKPVLKAIVDQKQTSDWDLPEKQNSGSNSQGSDSNLNSPIQSPSSPSTPSSSAFSHPSPLVHASPTATASTSSGQHAGAASTGQQFKVITQVIASSGTFPATPQNARSPPDSSRLANAPQSATGGQNGLGLPFSQQQGRQLFSPFPSTGSQQPGQSPPFPSGLSSAFPFGSAAKSAEQTNNLQIQSQSHVANVPSHIGQGQQHFHNAHQNYQVAPVHQLSQNAGLVQYHRAYVPSDKHLDALLARHYSIMTRPDYFFISHRSSWQYPTQPHAYYPFL